jgi:hypothetical protein
MTKKFNVDIQDVEIQEISFHRNGIAGEGFYAIRFRWAEDGGEKENFLATLFDAEGYCAVIGLDRIGTHGVGFTYGNSWRGDYFEDALRQAVEEHGLTNGVRIGPFALG